VTSAWEAVRSKLEKAPPTATSAIRGQTAPEPKATTRPRATITPALARPDRARMWRRSTLSDTAPAMGATTIPGAVWAAKESAVRNVEPVS
jgi:hypothetical protein